MNEWGVVGVFVVLLGLIVTVMGPVVYITRTLAKLTAAIEQMQAGQTGDRAQNEKSVQKLWNHNEEQDKQLHDHETRIQILERTD